MDKPLPLPYHSYMLRFWPEQQENGPTIWRYTLIDPQSGKRYGFLSLDSLVAYLSALTDELSTSSVWSTTPTPDP